MRQLLCSVFATMVLLQLVSLEGDLQAQDMRHATVGTIAHYPVEAYEAVIPELKRPVSVNLQDASVREVIREIANQADLGLSMDPESQALNRRVTIRTQGTVAEVLKVALQNTEMEALLSRYREIIIRERATQIPPEEDVQEAEVEHTVRGTVTDAEDGVTLPGVNIVVAGTTIGTTTRADGTYTMEVPSDDATLIFSFVGYEEQEVEIDGQSVIDIALQRDIAALDEVLVQVGYEVRGAETVTGSVSQISGADLEIGPTSNVTQMLQGTVPGLIGVQTSGRPGHDDVDLLVRGSSTLNDNNPLVVIDGIPDRQGGLARLNSNDIESISVLKDASAAIYGSRAANGVILVQTKRGISGDTQVSLNVRQGYSRPTVIPDMADAATYMTMLNEVDQYRGNPPRFSEEAIENHRNPPEGSFEYFNTDWYGVALRDYVPRTSADASVAGGTESLRYRVGLSGVTEQGILVNDATAYNQIGFRSNLDGDITEALTLSVDLHGRIEDRNNPGWGIDEEWRLLQRGFPNSPAFYPNGKPGPQLASGGGNPVVADESGYYDVTDYYLQTTLSLGVDIPVDGWTAEGSVSYDQALMNSRLWQTPWTLYNFGGFDEGGDPIMIDGNVGPPEPRLEQVSQNQRDILARAMTRYEATTGPHYTSVLLGTEYESGSGDVMSAFRRYFSTDQIDELFAGGTGEQDIHGTSWHAKRLNFFSRASYNYDERYLLELIARYDGSYIFPKGGRFGLFPAASVGWNVAQEEWFAGMTNDFFDRLQFRLSYGQTGNDRVEAYQFLRTFGFTGQFATGEGLSPTVGPSRVPNPDITWEVATQFDAGIRAGVFNDRLSVDLTYFNQVRDDILWFRSESMPEEVGFTLPRENIGQVRSWGGEVEVNYVQVIGADVVLRFGANASLALDEVVYIDEPPGRALWQRAEGHPMNTDLYYVSDGIFRDLDDIESNPSWPGARPGDIKFRDVNGDGVIDGQDRVRMDVNSEPDIMGGLQFGATFNQFDVDMLFQGATRVHHYVFTSATGERGNYFQFFADQRWTEDNPDATGPRAFNRDDPYWASNANSQFLQDASYLRLKTARIGYTLPDTWSGRLGASQLRVQLTGQNLLTFTPLEGMDPEIRSGGAHTYPPQQTFSVELHLNF